MSLVQALGNRSDEAAALNGLDVPAADEMRSLLVSFD